MRGRFAPTCTAELMTGLGEIAHRHDLPIQVAALWSLLPHAAQSHLSENKDEITWVAQLFPKQPSYTAV